jgi:hypothetical protein
MKALTIAGLIFLAGTQGAGATDPIHFHGQTLASTQLIHDITQQVIALGKGEMNCPAPNEISSDRVPLDAIPVDHRPLVPNGTVISVDHWAVSLCGRVGDFMIMYWPTDNGGAGFSVELFHITNADGSDGPMPGTK